MARVIVFGADLDKIISATDVRRGIRWGTASDTNSLLAQGLNEGQVDWLIGTGTRFVVAEDHGQIVGYVFFELGERVLVYDWLSIKLRVGHDVFSSGGFVVPERRGRRLLGAMRGFAARHFAARGYRRNLSAVDARNEASIRANGRIGAASLLTLTRVRLGNLVLVWQGKSLRHVDWGPKSPYVLSV